MANKQFYILEMNNFTEEEAQMFLSKALGNMEFGQKQGTALSHLNEKGVFKLKKYVLKSEEQK